MGKFGQVAVKAANYIQNGYEPQKAWETSSEEIFGTNNTSKDKGCPKNAFLGFYSGKGKNAEYARAALDYLKSNPDVDITVTELWKIATKGKAKTHNGQMDVVLSLYKEGLI